MTGFAGTSFAAICRPCPQRVYFGGAGRFDVTLGKTIILHPQWLIDMFTRIINAQDGENEVRASCIPWIELDEK
jgi:hypothetical protein